MNTTPAVSVIMPVYNAADFLDAAIDSVLRQTFADFELICFNDASTDSSLEILRHRAASDSRIKIIDSPRNVRQGGIEKLPIDDHEKAYLSINLSSELFGIITLLNC